LKTKVISIVIILLSFGYYYFRDDSSPVIAPDLLLEEKEEQQDIAQQQIHKVQQHHHQVLKSVLTPATLKSDAYRPFVDTDASMSLYLQKNNILPKKGKKFLKEALHSLISCRQDYCGEEADHDGYFDPAQIVSELSIKKILEISLNNSDDLAPHEWIAEETLYDLVKSPNHKTRSLAIGHLLTRKPVNDKLKTLFKVAEDLSGYGPGDIIKSSIPYIDDENKQDLVNTLENITRESKPHAIIDSLKSLEGLKLTDKQIEQIALPLCGRFKDDPTEEMNWNAMNLYIEKLSKESHLSLTLDTICR